MAAPRKEFVLTHVFKGVSSMKYLSDQYSPIEEHFGVPWRINAYCNNDYLGLYLFCEQEKNDKEWSIEVWKEKKIRTVDGKINSKASEVTFKSTDKSRGRGWSEYIKWEEMTKDYVVDDTLEVEIRVKIKRMTGIETKKNLMSFDESTKEFSDVVLVVENQKFHVSKLFLARLSPYFKTLLMGNFEESGKSEVTLQNIDPNDFQNYLEVLHGEPAIEESTVDGIVHLADMYDTNLAIRKCEQFLIKHSKKSLKEKLRLAHRYSLEKLRDHCLSKITTAADIRSVVLDDHSDMDHFVVGELMLKSLALNEK